MLLSIYFSSESSIVCLFTWPKMDLFGVFHWRFSSEAKGFPLAAFRKDRIVLGKMNTCDSRKFPGSFRRWKERERVLEHRTHCTTVYVHSVFLCLGRLLHHFTLVYQPNNRLISWISKGERGNLKKMRWYLEEKTINSFPRLFYSNLIDDTRVVQIQRRHMEAKRRNRFVTPLSFDL